MANWRLMMTFMLMKRRLGFSDEEMEKFKSDPRNEDVLARAPEMMKKTIILEVVESNGCNSQHRVGDRFRFDAFGNLLTEDLPERVCIYAFGAAQNLIYAATELLFADADPNEMRFKRTGCFDVGLECEGWGKVVLELHVE